MQELDFSKVAPELTPDWILSRITQLEIMTYYLGSFKIGRSIHSPFRKDTLASGGVFVAGNGNLLFKDFKTTEVLNCWQVVKKRFNCNFNKALQIIVEDFGLIDLKTKTVPQSFYPELENIDKDLKKQTIIQFEPEKWNKYNLKFWERGEITKKELEQEQDIFAIKSLFINHKEIPNSNKYWRYAYVVNCFINNKWEKRVKIYSPQDKKMKFLSSVPLDCPGGIDKLPHLDERLFIWKSKKDSLVTKRYFTDQIWLQNESENSLPENWIKQFKKEYNRIILCFGSDYHAVSVSQKITKKYNIEYYNTPKEDYDKYELEDPYDIVSTFGRPILESHLRQKKLII